MKFTPIQKYYGTVQQNSNLEALALAFCAFALVHPSDEPF